MKDGNYTVGYAVYRYLNYSAQRALSGADGNIVDCCRRRDTANGRYIIETDGGPYELGLTGISINVFSTGIAILRFECRYESNDAEIVGRDSLDFDNTANDFGRIKKIYPLFVIHNGRNYIPAPANHKRTEGTGRHPRHKEVLS